MKILKNEGIAGRPAFDFSLNKKLNTLTILWKALMEKNPTKHFIPVHSVSIVTPTLLHICPSSPT
jgi:hypothetical protein